jgi:protein-disulfide isomerase
MREFFASPLLRYKVLAPLLILTACQSDTDQPDPEIVYEILDQYFEENGEAQISDILERIIKKRQAEAPDSVEKRLGEPRVSVPVGKSPSWGPGDAPILFVEYGDFLCPFSRGMQKTIQEWITQYPGKIRRVFKNFPSRVRERESKPLAVAALAAHRQGKFWEFYEAAFKIERDHNESFYREFVKKQDLNAAQFNRDRKDPELLKQVEDEFAEGEKFGVPGTPTYFFNGVRLSGLQPLQNFSDITASLLGEKAVQ